MDIQQYLSDYKGTPIDEAPTVGIIGVFFVSQIVDILMYILFSSTLLPFCKITIVNPFFFLPWFFFMYVGDPKDYKQVADFIASKYLAQNQNPNVRERERERERERGRERERERERQTERVIQPSSSPL